MRFLVHGLIVAAALSASAHASAGVYADDLSKCLVRKSSEADNIVFMRWMLSALSASPAVHDIASVTPAQHQEYDRKAAELFQRLMLTDCRQEVVAALRYEGPASIKQGFSVMGRVAVRSLMTDPKVTKEFDALAEAIDPAKFAALLAEADIHPPAPAPAAPAK